MTISPGVRWRGRRLPRVLALAAVAQLVSCTDMPTTVNKHHTTQVAPDTGLVVSGPQQNRFAIRETAILAGGVGDTVFFISMPVGTVNGEGRLLLQNRRTGEKFEAQVVDGGFDPVPMYGRAGDTVDVGSGNGARTTVVPNSGPPVVVRTQPPKKKVDVPLNASLLVYFSEPVDEQSVTTSSIQLRQAGAAVSGSVRLADSSHVSVEFVAAASLTAGTDYELVVAGVRGQDGEALSVPDTIAFTTGSSTTGPPVSLFLSFTATQIVLGATYQMVAVARDASGNILTGQPITWQTSDSRGLAVNSSGLLTALAEGSYAVEADLDALRAVNDSIMVRAQAASLVVRPASGSALFPSALPATLHSRAHAPGE